MASQEEQHVSTSRVSETFHNYAASLTPNTDDVGNDEKYNTEDLEEEYGSEDEQVSDLEDEGDNKDETETKSKGLIESLNDYLESIFSTYEEYDEEIEEELTAMYVLLWRILSGTVGIIALIVIIIKYPQYLHTLHENQLWFSNIKELEREISFRTEQGLYYSYYKQILLASSWSEGIEELLHDNGTEHGRTISIIHRFNILPEIFLSALYKWIKPAESPIFFYVASVFKLHGVFLATIFMTAWYLSSSCLAGVIASVFFIIHRLDTTRVNYTVPLRESFAIPLLYMQILFICTYLRSDRYQNVKAMVIYLLSVAFFQSWQFAPFVNLCQLLAFLSLGRLHLIPPSKVTALVILVGTSLVTSCFLQLNPPLVISSPAFSLLVPALILSFTPPPDKRLGSLARICVVFSEMALMLISTVLINGFVKLFLNSGADSHIYQLLLAKFQIGDEKDFDSRLYICNEAFKYLDIQSLYRLTRSGLLPIYFTGIFALMLALTFDIFKTTPNEDVVEDLFLSSDVYNEHKEPIQPENVDSLENDSSKDEVQSSEKLAVQQIFENSEAKDNSHCKASSSSVVPEIISIHSITANRPDLSLVLALSVMWSILAGMILRLKVLWLPSVCIACGVFINDCRLYNYIFFKCGRLLSHLPRWFPAFFKVAVGLGFAAALAYMYQGQISSDIWPDEVYEFWDPDTVELMEWINHYTPPDVVFAGSMQLLASVKLCTGRHIANHPHYEDAWLRHRTHDIYQIYGCESPEYVHMMLRDAGVTHIIVEDSICLAPSDQKHPLCRTIDIVDLYNNHVPAEGSHGIAGLKQPHHGRFCDAVHHDIKEYKKFFSLVMSNKTFRVYRIAVT